MRNTLFFIFILSVNNLFAQANSDFRRDQTWLLGNNYKMTQMDFMSYPYKMKFVLGDISFGAPYAYGLMNNIDGSYLFYTQGSYTADSSHQVLIHGDSVIAGSVGNGAWTGNQATIILPYPEHSNQYYIPTMTVSHTVGVSCVDVMAAAIADFNRPDGRGELINRSIIVQQNLCFGGGMAACRHANGRDWWLLVNNSPYSHQYYRYLLDPRGMRFIGIQTIGNLDRWAGESHATFSPDGTKYAIMDSHLNVDSQYVTLKHLKVFDFDRCTGLLSNAHETVVPLERSWTVGTAFSRNSRYLYLTNAAWVYQYDTQTHQLLQIAEFDRFFDADTQYYTGFGSIFLAPDDKIYIATPRETHYLHVINAPDSAGLACNLQQHAITIPGTANHNLPNLPHFGLGAANGTVCDSLGYGAAKFANLRILPYTLDFWNVQVGVPQVQTTTAYNIGDTTLTFPQTSVQQAGGFFITLPPSIPRIVARRFLSLAMCRLSGIFCRRVVI